MTTLLIGNFGAKNIGDELILALALKNYPKSVVMTVNSKFSQNFCETNFDTIPPFPAGFRSFFKYLISAKYRNTYKLLNKKIDQIIFPGGGLFAIKFKAVWIWFITIFWCRILFPKATIQFQHQGVDSHFKFLEKKMTAWAFKKAEKISVRDTASTKALKKYGIKKNILIDQDQVEKSITNYTLQITNKKKLILVNAKSILTKEYYDVLNNNFDQYKKYFLNFDPKDEFGIRHNFFDKIITPKTKTEVFELFSKAEFAIGERLHFLILGNHFCGNKKTFTIKTPYSEKVQNFCSKNKIKILSN